MVKGFKDFLKAAPKKEKEAGKFCDELVAPYGDLFFEVPKHNRGNIDDIRWYKTNPLKDIPKGLKIFIELQNKLAVRCKFDRKQSTSAVYSTGYQLYMFGTDIEICISYLIETRSNDIKLSLICHHKADDY